MNPEDHTGSDAARDLFDRLTDHPRSEWEEMLAAEVQAGTDPGIVTQVRKLLEFASTQGATGEVQSLAPLQPLRQAVDQLLGPAMPTQIGPYTLQRRLGEGAFGVVYLATQTQPVQRTVALKILKSGLHSEDLMQRFRQEQQALASMNHPNVATVYDAGCSELGLPYLVMEYVPGITITKYCDEHRLSLRERLELFIPVCEAVQHAHGKGTIHRDLKPSNVLVTEEGGKPRPKVIDFGVAKAIDQTLATREAFTQAGQIIGTPEYMSPEQAGLGAMDVDTRSDVYSLGVMLYELLTGVLPFDPKSLRSAAYAEIQRIIREVEPPTPSARLTRLGDADAANIARARQAERERLINDLRKELEWIPVKAMRKDRERRYGSAAELAEEITRYLQGQTLRAGPETRRYRTAKFIGRNRAAVGGTALILTAIVAALGVSLNALANTRKARDRFETANLNATKRFMDVLRLTSEAGDTKRTLLLIDQALDEKMGDEVELRLHKVAALDGSYRPKEASAELAKLEGRKDLGTNTGLVLLWRGDLELLGIVTDHTVKDPQETIKNAIVTGLPPAEKSYAEGLIAPDYLSARAAFERCVQMAPGHVRGQLMLGLLDILGGELESGRARATALSMRSPDNPSPLALEALALTLQGRFKECEPALLGVQRICGSKQEGLLRWILGTFDTIRSSTINGDASKTTDLAKLVISRLPGLLQTTGDKTEQPVRLPAFVAAKFEVADIFKTLRSIAFSSDSKAAEDLLARLTETSPGIGPMFDLSRARNLIVAGKYAEGEKIAMGAIGRPMLFDVRSPLYRAALICAHQQYVVGGDLDAKARGRTIAAEFVRLWQPAIPSDWDIARRVGECGDVASARYLLDALEQRYQKRPASLWHILSTRMIIEYFDQNDSGVFRYAVRLSASKPPPTFDRTEVLQVLTNATSRFGVTPSIDGKPLNLDDLRQQLAPAKPKDSAKTGQKPTE